jgi:hypothetical protein
MALEHRIFLESRPAFNVPGVAGHLYLVLREVDVGTDGTYDNVMTDDDLVIQGTPNDFTMSKLDVNSSEFLLATSDVYGPGETPDDRNSLDITSWVMAGANASTVADAWQPMTTYGAGINNSDYDYDIPYTGNNYIANSNSTALSILNHVNVDIRELPNPDNTGSYLDLFLVDFPGATEEHYPTLLGGNDRQIIASTNLLSGIRLLGRDDIEDIFIGTKFQDHYFGEFYASYSATYDIVSFERLPSDLGVTNGLNVKIVQENLSNIPGSTEPWGVYGVNTDAEDPDLLYGIEEVRLTAFADHLDIDTQTFSGGWFGDVTPLTVDLGDQTASQGMNTGDTVDAHAVGNAIVVDLRDPTNQFVAELGNRPVVIQHGITSGSFGTMAAHNSAVFGQMAKALLNAPDLSGYEEDSRLNLKNAESLIGTSQADIIYGPNKVVKADGSLDLMT